MTTSFFMMISGVLSFSAYKKHVLLMLISIEMILLSSVLCLMENSNWSNKTHTALILMTFMVSESAVAMSTLVSFSKNSGNDMHFMN